MEAQLDIPMVIKMPDGASRSGVFKIENGEQLREVATRLFRESELILAQAYTHTPYDWRIGVLDRQPLYACQYFMSKSHWQIVQHDGRGEFTEGGLAYVGGRPGSRRAVPAHHRGIPSPHRTHAGRVTVITADPAHGDVTAAPLAGFPGNRARARRDGCFPPPPTHTARA